MYNRPFTRAFNKKGHHHTCKTLELSGNRKKNKMMGDYKIRTLYLLHKLGGGRGGGGAAHLVLV